MFLFLALAFGLGFVGFGVGAGGVGFGDVLRGSGGNSGVPSVSDAEQRILDNPKDAKAFRDLATAHQAAGSTDDAIEALESLVALRPKDIKALRDLATQYLLQLEEAQQRYQIAEFRAAYLAPGTTVASAIRLGGSSIDPDPISSAVSGQITQDSSAALADAQQASAQYIDVYRRIATTDPKDASLQLEFAQAAESAADYSTAISAYEMFLTLPNIDPTQAADVQRQLEQLRRQFGTTG
jgi:tetratricopeptide (TPR) repeat protein